VDKKKVLETLFDRKVVKILCLLMNNPDEEFYLREIAKMSKVSPATTYRVLNTMKALELVYEEKNRYLKVYYLNRKNTVMFADLFEDKKSALQEFSEFMSNLLGVHMVILHGSEERDKASILVVGEKIDQDAIRLKAVEIKEKYAFNIIYLVLGQEQYNQMLSMGLYPGKKVVLFSKD